jgi:hypothetical protein
VAGINVGSVVFLGGAFGLVCGSVFSFIEGKIEPRVWGVGKIQPGAPVIVLLHKHKRQRNPKTTQETLKE